MAKVTVHYRDVDGQLKRFETTADQLDVYETRALAEELGRTITERPGGSHSSPVVGDGPELPDPASPQAFAATSAAGPSGASTPSGTAAGGTTATTLSDDYCVLVNGIVICGK